MSSQGRVKPEVMASEKSIEFHHVSFRLPDGRTLLSDLNLEVHRGETLVLLGRSGSGKTTTFSFAAASAMLSRKSVYSPI